MESFIVADDHPLFRDGLVRILGQEFPDLQVEEAGTLQQALELARQGEPPAGLLLDLLYHGQDVRPALHALRREFRRSSLIVISMLENPEVIEQVMAAGADGFIGKGLPPDTSPRPSARSAPENSWCRRWPVARPTPMPAMS